jgi:hypothetical protein
MHDQDLPQFSKMLDQVCALLSRGAYVPSTGNTAMWFRAVKRFEIDDIRRAFDAHVSDPQRGRFVPVPADLIAQMQRRDEDDGRPGAEEAWATALLADDENSTLRWTRETAAAWAIARPVLRLGDEVGARMAFRESYARLVAEAREYGEPVRWEESIGMDLEQRHAAIGYEAPDVLMLGSNAPASVDGRNRARELLLRLRDRMTSTSHEIGADGVEKQRTAALKAQAAELTKRKLEDQQ